MRRHLRPRQLPRVVHHVPRQINPPPRLGKIQMLRRQRRQRQPIRLARPFVTLHPGRFHRQVQRPIRRPTQPVLRRLKLRQELVGVMPQPQVVQVPAHRRPARPRHRRPRVKLIRLPPAPIVPHLVIHQRHRPRELLQPQQRHHRRKRPEPPRQLFLKSLSKIFSARTLVIAIC